MKRSKISVIVPVYNVEKYLPKCIDSILQQTFTDFELLLIDDGSPDNSGIICDEYASKDNRIQVIHKKNAGVSAARNTGLEYAQGKWITFVDSDDWLEKDCFQTCINHIKAYNLDLLQFSYKQIDKTKKIQLHIEQTPKLKFEQYIASKKINLTVWGGFFNKEIITKNNIKFDTRLKLGEDQLFVYRYIASCNFCMKINHSFYNYRYNNESASINSKPNDCINSIKIFQQFEYRHLFEYQIQDTIRYFLFIILKTKTISNSIIYELIKNESFNLLKPTRKLESIFFFLNKISKRMSIRIISAIIK